MHPENLWRDPINQNLYIQSQALQIIHGRYHQMAQLVASLNLCKDHGDRSAGIFGACIVCGAIQLASAISEIDGLFIDPEKRAQMIAEVGGVVSDFDIHMDEEAVVARVKSALEELWDLKRERDLVFGVKDEQNEQAKAAGSETPDRLLPEGGETVPDGPLSGTSADPRGD